jgi:uncharacterized membrane protein YedE/YeeE
MHGHLPALAGGALIGLAAVTLMLSLGRIAGVSGIVASTLADLGSRRPGGDFGWRLAFLAGLAIGPWLPVLAGGERPVITIAQPLPVVVLAGILVGIGVRLGNGCTSGHGVCGLARGSARSLAATLVFIGVAALVVGLMRHGIGG